MADWFCQYENGRIFVRKIFIMAAKYIKPTESELEILNILWQNDVATVREVHEELAKSKDVGYTTTLKLMQIMHEKGLVRRDESMRTHVYQPAVNKEKTQKHLLDKMIDSLFGGSSTQLVLQALGNGDQKVSAEELEQIQTLIDNLKKQ
jgi:predicted transcriptional regulator